MRLLQFIFDNLENFALLSLIVALFVIIFGFGLAMLIIILKVI